MILALLLLAAAEPAPMTAIDTERAFAADAQKLGQWTAFRKYATDDAYMFVPRAINAQKFLKDRKDPPISVFWWPGRSYVSCDGSVAVNTGPWVREWGKSVGYFTTVWKRQPDGSWKWVYDAGDELKIARAEGGDTKPTISSCKPVPTGKSARFPPKELKNPMMLGLNSPIMSGGGRSADGTLDWKFLVDPHGARRFFAQLWDGKRWRLVVDDKVTAPPK